jgi:hypothetical protein
MPAKVTTNPRSGTVIAKEQNRPKTYTVLTPIDDYAEGQLIYERDDVIGYYKALAEAQLSKEDQPLALLDKDILECVKRVDGDGQDEEDTRVEFIINAHTAVRPFKIAAAKTDVFIDTLAPKLAKAAGRALDSGWKAFEETKYKAAELAYLFQTNMTPEEITQVPNTKSKKPKDAKDSDNVHYNIGYRTRVASDRGPPTWVGDLYERMPDVNGTTLGKSLMKEIETLDPDNKGVKEIKKKDHVRGTKLNRLLTKRKNAVEYSTNAFALLQAMALINEFDLVSVSFKMDDGDNTKPDLQNLTPIRIVGYDKSKRKGGTVNNVGLVGVTDILSLTMLHTLDQKSATMGKVLEAKTTRQQGIEPFKKGEDAYKELKRLGMWWSPEAGTKIGRRDDFAAAIRKKDSDSIPIEQDLIRFAHYVAEFLAPFREELDQKLNSIEVMTKERDNKRKQQAKETDAKALAALANNGHKTAA